MRKFIIHPTHRKFLRLLRERYKSGTPVVMLKGEVDDLLKKLPSVSSPTLRNQLIYREVLRAMNRPLSEIQQCTGFVVFNEKTIRTIESVYAKVERKQLCPVIMVSILTAITKHHKRRR